jgi:uncharacterized membrane protein
MGPGDPVNAPGQWREKIDHEEAEMSPEPPEKQDAPALAGANSGPIFGGLGSALWPIGGGIIGVVFGLLAVTTNLQSALLVTLLGGAGAAVGLFIRAVLSGNLHFKAAWDALRGVSLGRRRLR